MDSKSFVNTCFQWRVPAIVGVVATVICSLFIQYILRDRPEIGYLGFSTPWILGGIGGAAINLFFLNLCIGIYHMDNANSAPKGVKYGVGFTLIITICAVGFFVWAATTASGIAGGSVIQSKESLESIFWRAVWSMFVLSAAVIPIDYCMFPDDKVHEREALLAFDGAVCLAIFLTISLPWFMGDIIESNNWAASKIYADFMLSFKSGAITFEVILACLLFDPRHFFKNNRAADPAPVKESPATL